jgi:hypothetical protein
MRWAGAMRQDIRYTSTDCFETFPLPRDLATDPELEVVSKRCYEERGAQMLNRGEGLTQIYNRMHDAEENDADIIRLRKLHRDMDQAVLGSYGWHDIPTACEFILEYEDREGSGTRPWRYRWPDDVREEVLMRLTRLNSDRAEEEHRAGGGEKGPRPSRTAVSNGQQDEALF